MGTTTDATTTRHLDRPDGRIAYEVHPARGAERGLVLAVPGMGDLRSTYRFLAPALAAAGYRVVAADLRGHGDSDATFSEYGDEATAGDVVALLEALREEGQPVAVVGSSMAAGSAVLAAAQRPDLVDDLVLLGPFVRDPQASALARWATASLVRVLMVPAWAAVTWRSFLPRLYAGARPGDFDAHRAAIVASLRRPGHAAAFSRTTRTSHAPAEAALPAVGARVLVVVGAADPDFPDPRAEASWIAGRVSGRVVLVDDAGHYPHAQRPDVVVPAVRDFLAAGQEARRA
ncbi:alpha/beta fold hydrolase [Quadrisphaera sp. DSM 44207]|uniref:alpha/beta fold hydrolase n=1 Tax=Quadrisphaera sp. DSM 44207 TaxID=1881057 RepID=UPI00087E2453|nr:alpha/beta fold hydrolase [Quadrisphaera sp. DSM 44207]SDQ08736.1 Lysophospholipase, alpha-beta hydrolase superfamily [Quadrisphaera sp. DSM 44207]